MYELAAALDPDTYEALATATFAEMVLAGYTVVGEFHYLHHGPGGTPYGDANEIGRRLLAAAGRAGIRITLLDTCYLHGGIGSRAERRAARASATARAEAMGRAGRRARRRGLGDLPRRWRRSTRCGRSIRMRCASWPAGPESAAPCSMPTCRSSRRRTTSASPRTAARRSSVLDDVGALSDRFTAVHATHVTDSRHRAARRRARSRCCICPTTERELADGIGPTAALRRAGIELCLGSDSHAVIDPFEEARAIELDERLASLRRGTHQPADLLAAATVNGYESLGWSGGGRFAAGAPRRLRHRVVRRAPPRRRRPRADPVAAVVFAAAPGDVRHVVVGGEHVVRDGVHQRVDVVAALDSSIPPPGRRPADDRLDGHPQHRRGCHVTTRRSGHGPRGVLQRRVAGRSTTARSPTSEPGLRRPPTRRSTPRGSASMPGFVDSHSHLVFAGDRSDEFAARMAGEPYTAGGIAVTVAATRAGERRIAAAARPSRAAGRGSRRSGTTTIEIKSGYGLTVDDEVAPARRSPASSPPRPRSSAPTSCRTEYHGRADDYVALVCGEMLDRCAPHARWIDAFCEAGAFDADQCRAVLEAGRAGRARSAPARQPARSGEGVAAGRGARVRVGRPLHLPLRRRRRGAGRQRHRRHVPAGHRLLDPPADTPTRAGVIDAGVTVALAANCNPGSSYTTSMPFCIALAVRELGMTAGRGDTGRHRRRGGRTAARRHRHGSARGAEPTSSSSTPPRRSTSCTAPGCRSSRRR